MKLSNSVSALGFALAISAPLAALAGGLWETTHDEAGSRIAIMQSGMMSGTAAANIVTPLRAGEISIDRQYEFLGEEGGWQLRPMEYRVESGRLAHVDDPVGHMLAIADNSPLTAEVRRSLERGGA